MSLNRLLTVLEDYARSCRDISFILIDFKDKLNVSQKTQVKTIILMLRQAIDNLEHIS